MIYIGFKKENLKKSSCLKPQGLDIWYVASPLRGPGTNYINISQESKAERNSMAIIWQMDASDWMMRLK